LSSPETEQPGAFTSKMASKEIGRSCFAAINDMKVDTDKCLNVGA